MNRSVFKTIFKFLASLQLAMILMAVIVIASIAGTLYESKFNADVAREYIYDAPWFNFWLGVLCINLFSVAAIRYPWKSHQTGFVITHAGIITLLIGAMIDRNWGIEGYLHLTRGEDGTSTMELHTQELRVYVRGVEEYGTATFRVKGLTTPGKRNFAARSPADDVKVNVIDVKPVAQTTEIEPGAKGKPAVSFTLRGPMMGQNAMSLFLGDEQNLGRATVSFTKGMPPAPAAPIATKTVAVASEAMVPRHERFYVFAKNSEPMGRTLVGEPTGVGAKLVVDPAGKTPQLNLKLLGKEFTFSVTEIGAKEIALEGLADWKLTLSGYYPNFHFDNGQPGTLDGKPENPAIVFELKGPRVKANAAEPAASPHGGMGHGSSSPVATESEGTNGLAFYLGADGKLRYLAKSMLKGELAGEVAIEQPVSLGWGPGAEFVVQSFIDKALPRQSWRPIPGEFKPDAPGLGLLCRVASGGESKEIWVGKSTVDDTRLTSLKINGKFVDLAFCNSTFELPFSVSLLKFDAPRHEGLDDSTNFMEFKSTLSFDGDADAIQLKADSKTAKALKRRVLEGAILEVTKEELRFQQPLPVREPIEIPMEDVEKYEKHSHDISMNRPTTYPVSAVAPWVGTNYKFSQAGHNFPSNPDYSGVQVLRDPGWMPEWLGSLMICFGIFTMFYLKPYFRRAPVSAPVTKTPVPSNSESLSLGVEN